MTIFGAPRGPHTSATRDIHRAASISVAQRIRKPLGSASGSARSSDLSPITCAKETGAAITYHNVAYYPEAEQSMTLELFGTDW
jgi:hypothetical protein